MSDVTPFLIDIVTDGFFVQTDSTGSGTGRPILHFHLGAGVLKKVCLVHWSSAGRAFHN